MTPPAGFDPNQLRRVASEIRRKMDLEASLNIAQKRQRVMLPSAPELPDYEFASTYDPASEISGDFYDYIQSGDQVAVLVCEVSGTGVPGALVSATARAYLRNELERGGTLKAAYLNPRPIHVSKAVAVEEGQNVKVGIELQDTGYPGCLYTLVFNRELKQLQGTYFQAAQGQTYEVTFVRMPEE